MAVTGGARAAAVLACVGLASDVHAHPLARDRYSYRVAVQVGDGGLRALAVLEVPFETVMAALRTADGRPPDRSALDAWNRRVWAGMGDHLLLRVDGRVVPGAWRPSDSPLNARGSVSEGFFVYIVEFAPTEPWALRDGATVLLANAGWSDVPMALSAWVVAEDGWRVVDSTAALSLPSSGYDLNDPRYWSDDPALRLLEARFAR